MDAGCCETACLAWHPRSLASAEFPPAGCRWVPNAFCETLWHWGLGGQARVTGQVTSASVPWAHMCAAADFSVCSAAVFVPATCMAEWTSTAKCMQASLMTPQPQTAERSSKHYG